MKNLNLPLISLVLSVICLLIAIVTGNDVVKTLLGAPAFIGVILSVSLIDGFSLQRERL